MPLPKHKISKRRGRLRRAAGYYTLSKMDLSTCPNCGGKKVSHRVCPHCGFYNGKQILTKVVKEEE